MHNDIQYMHNDIHRVCAAVTVYSKHTCTTFSIYIGLCGAQASQPCGARYSPKQFSLPTILPSLLDLLEWTSHEKVSAYCGRSLCVCGGEGVVVPILQYMIVHVVA